MDGKGVEQRSRERNRDIFGMIVVEKLGWPYTMKKKAIQLGHAILPRISHEHSVHCNASGVYR
jgi:hypothetical protein